MSESKGTLLSPPLLLSADVFAKTIRYLILHCLPYGIIRNWNDKLPFQLTFLVNHNPVIRSKETAIQKLKMENIPQVQEWIKELEEAYQTCIRFVTSFIQSIFKKHDQPHQLPWRLSCYAGSWTIQSSSQYEFHMNPFLFTFYENKAYFEADPLWCKEWTAWNQKYFPLSHRANADRPKEKILKSVSEFMQYLHETKTTPSKEKEKTKSSFASSSTSKNQKLVNLQQQSDEEDDQVDSKPSSSSSSDLCMHKEGIYPIPSTLPIPSPDYTKKNKTEWQEINFVSQFLFYLFQRLMDHVTNYDLEQLFVLWVENKMHLDLKDKEALNFDRVATLFQEQDEMIHMLKTLNVLYVKYYK